MKIRRILATTALVAWLVISAHPVDAAFPGDNGRIAFNSDRDGASDIYTMNPDGSDAFKLTDHPASDTSPAWSPDGTEIAFASNRDGNFEIYVMNADGAGETNLTNNAIGNLDIRPAWSPDGTKIAFESNRDGNFEIYDMNADGTGQTNLTNHPGADAVPAWSPDGTKIAFSSDRDGNFDVYVMNADGTGVTNLTHPEGGTDPTWSPDGTKIAFTTARDGLEEIYVMNADGSGHTNLTNHAASDAISTWSPDGTKIAFSSNRDGNFEVYVMNADGTGQTNLTNNAATDWVPDWQPAVVADLAVLSLDLSELDAAGPSDLLVGAPFEFAATATFHNFGDVDDDSPQSPVKIESGRSIEVPAGVTGSVEVTTEEAPATIFVDAILDDGQDLVLHDQPAGTVVDVEGPGSITVVSESDAALEPGSDRIGDAVFGIRCDEPGLHDVGFRAEIASAQLNVIDPDEHNNTLMSTHAIECVAPVQVNIRPGNPNNFINPNSNQVVAVATLTTAAGEYGLPLDFDATTIDHSTVRFGTLPALETGGGTAPSPNLPFIQDSFEMDDSTKDGDLDMVLRFPASGADMYEGTTEACLLGQYLGAAGSMLTFFGCDVVQIQS